MKTALLIPYFGPLPPWWPLFVVSIEHNPNYTFFLITDQTVDNPPDNLVVVKDNFDNYCAQISAFLGIDFKPAKPYKLCDARPVFGAMHKDLIAGYDFYGHCDVDIVFGKIDDFMPDDRHNYHAISTHNRRTAGHFSIFKNTQRNLDAYKKIKNFEYLLLDEVHHGVDENHFSRIYFRHKSKPDWLRKLLFKFDWHTRQNYFKEQFSTPYTHNPWVDGNVEFPTEWYWKDGRITSNRDGDREFMYLHFMALKSSKFFPYGDKAPWEGIDNLNQVPDEHAKHGFRINLDGFFPLQSIPDN